MANFETHFLFELEDAQGDRAVMDLTAWVPDTAAASDLVTASDNINTALGNAGHVTNAKVVRRGVRVLYDRAQTDPAAPNPPLDAWYPNVVNQARLQFANANGDQAQVSIPAPISGIFHAAPSGNSVDLANTAVHTFVTTVETILTDASGTALNLVEGGTYRTRYPRVRKPNR